MPANIRTFSELSSTFGKNRFPDFPLGGSAYPPCIPIACSAYYCHYDTLRQRIYGMYAHQSFL